MQRQELPALANTIRRDIIEMLVHAKSGHAAGPLGMADIFTALYFGILRHEPQRPDWAGRDRLVLSNGHICPVLYATLARAGYFPIRELSSYRQFGSRLQGHPSAHQLPGVENSSGPLGQGYSQAVGMALALQLQGQSNQVYCITSDGEHNEGQVWEAVLLAAKHRLHNLAVIIDRNNIQIDGHTEEVLPLESLRAKYLAFNWHVLEIDGHDFDQISEACQMAKAVYEKPVAIIAHTIPGKGVDFMQWNHAWHGRAPTPAEAKQALQQLRSLGGRVRSDD